MKLLLSPPRVVALMLSAGLAGGALAQNPGDHASHHPAPSSQSATLVSTMPAMSGEADMRNMDAHWQRLQAMHAQMAAAKTPEQRQALMEEHMAAMRETKEAMPCMGAMQGQAGGMPMPMMHGQNQPVSR